MITDTRVYENRMPNLTPGRFFRVSFEKIHTEDDYYCFGSEEIVVVSLRKRRRFFGSKLLGSRTIFKKHKDIRAADIAQAAHKLVDSFLHERNEEIFTKANKKALAGDYPPKNF